jgi:hypothetical protein
MKAIGVDIGTAFIGSMWQEKTGTRAKYVRDGFFKMPWAQQRVFMLEKSHVNFLVKDRPNVPGQKDIFVVGNEAFDMAVMFGQDLKRPLKDGIISAQEKETEFILKEIIKEVVGVGEPGDVAVYSIPADPVDRDFNNIYHREIFKRFITEAGYKASPLNEGMAVIYSELEDKDFSGLGISFGAGLVNIALAYRSMEIFSFSISNSGDYIDKNVASSRAIPISEASAYKERVDDEKKGSKAFDLLHPVDDVDEAIKIFYEAMLEYVLQYIVANVEKHQKKIKLSEPLSFVVAGGTTMPKGFMTLLENALKAHPLPIPVGKVWQAKNPVMAVCRGCLRMAQSQLSDEKYDGVVDISGGENKKHQYPTKPKEVVEAPKVKTQKDKTEAVDKARIVENSAGMTDAINL